jgi:hypothetical protein
MGLRLTFYSKSHIYSEDKWQLWQPKVWWWQPDQWKDIVKVATFLLSNRQQTHF